jgi:hypothetical protein
VAAKIVHVLRLGSKSHFRAVTGYYTDWETAASVFVAVISLFTNRTDR